MVVSCFLITRHGDHVCAPEVIRPQRSPLTTTHLIGKTPSQIGCSSLRMPISFDSHPCDVKHRFHRVRMIAPVCPTYTRCGHGCTIISGTHLASLLHGCPTQVHGVVCLLLQASRMRSCVACPPRVAWIQNTQSDRGSFTSARRCASYGP